MKKILHITNWYPHQWDDVEAVFIKEQYDLFSKVTDSELLHVQVRYDKKSWFKYECIKYSDTETGYYILSRINSSRLIEIITAFLLIWTLVKSKYKNYDLLHFHISYPLLSYYHLLKKIIKTPTILSEHWSAFHYNFYMPKTTKKLNRIKNIFKQKIPLITVSKALLKDIQEFSGTKNFPSIVIPNVIDHSVYSYKVQKVIPKKPVFFIVNCWREIKNPLPMLDAFAVLTSKGVDYDLKIGGYGDYLEKIKSHVNELKIESFVEYLGKMKKEEIARQLIDTSAYLFSSKYETFSAVCAQALSCGCPLIGPPIPAILEYAGGKEMINLKSDNIQGWEVALMEFIENKDSFNRKQIAIDAQQYLSHKKIQKQYFDFIS